MKILNFKKYCLNEADVLSKKAKRGQRPINKITIFGSVPKDVDYKIVKFIIDNYGPQYYKSPWSHSYYSDRVGWDFKPDGVYRMSDHWNFYDKSGNLHCRTSNDVGNDKERWSIGKYHEKTNTFEILLSLPPNNSPKNREKINLLKGEFIPIHKKWREENKNKLYSRDSFYTNLEDKIEKYRYITDNITNLDFYITTGNQKRSVELILWKSSKISFIENGEEKSITNKDLTKRTSYEGYINGRLVIKKDLKRPPRIFK